jgi:hypothetical protein
MDKLSITKTEKNSVIEEETFISQKPKFRTVYPDKRMGFNETMRHIYEENNKKYYK